MDAELIRLQIDNYLQNLEEASSSRQRSPLPAKSITGFFGLVNSALQQEQAASGVQNPIPFMEDFPEEDDNLISELITYSVEERKPGAQERVTQSQVMSDRKIRGRAKMFRESIDDPNNPGCKIYTYGQEFDNHVRFNIWARTNKVANRRALWFEDFMERWRWFFQASGVKRVLYERRDADMHLSPENRKLVCRPLIYYVRTERVTAVREYVLRNLVVDLSSTD